MGGSLIREKGCSLGSVSFYLVELSDGPEVLPVPLGRGQAGIELEAANHVEDCVFGEHELEEGILVEEENVLEDVVEVVEALHVVEILAHVEQVQELLDVPAGRGQKNEK